MSLIEYTLNGKINKVDQAIQRIKAFDPISTGLMDTPYYVAYSGGKDSDALRILFELAGVKYDLVHNHTTVDAPETVRYVRSIPGIQISYPELSMWQLIVKKRVPPTRIARYCCRDLKEKGGEGRFVVTGVRWAESVRRKKSRGGIEILGSTPSKNIILNADNDESRKMLENCQLKGKRMLNPIVDWSDDDVWEFLGHHGCKSNPLYQCGYTRIGCVGCPMSSNRAAEFARYPKYAQNYIRAFDRMIVKRREDGLETAWRTGQEVFDWWTSKHPPKEIDGQIKMEAQHG